MPIVSTVLFETASVNVYKVPAGAVSLKQWQLDDKNLVWKGSLKLIEQEVIREDDDPVPTDNVGEIVWDTSKKDHLEPSISPPIFALRAKLELYNVWSIPPAVGNLTTISKDFVWGEVWYNPCRSTDDFSVANNSQETIQMTESPKAYQIITQLPGSGYNPQVKGTKASETGPVQVALGLKFEDSFNASSFSEAMALYKRRYTNFEEQYGEELISKQSLEPPVDSDSSDEFDDFVSA